MRLVRRLALLLLLLLHHKQEKRVAAACKLLRRATLNEPVEAELRVAQHIGTHALVHVVGTEAIVCETHKQKAVLLL